MKPGRSPRWFRIAPAWPLAAGLLGLVAFGGALLPPEGPVFFHVQSPAPGLLVGPEGVEVLVLFASSGRIAPETFRALLNGADVTDALAVGENGAYGRLHGLLDGENVLRLEAFGRAPWSRERLFEQAQEIRLRRLRRLDAARG